MPWSGARSQSNKHLTLVILSKIFVASNTCYSVGAKILKRQVTERHFDGTQCVESSYEGTCNIHSLFIKREHQNGLFSHFLYIFTLSMRNVKNASTLHAQTLTTTNS